MGQERAVSWDLTKDVQWVELQVPARAEGIAAAARSWSTMPTAAELLSKKVADADLAKQQGSIGKAAGGKDQPSRMDAGEDPTVVRPGARSEGESCKDVQGI
jgi:hypothetical protein